MTERHPESKLTGPALEKRAKKQEEKARKRTAKALQFAETVIDQLATKRRRRRTSSMRHQLGLLKNELQRSPKRGGPRRNPTEIQAEMENLRAKIREILPGWEE